MAPEKAPAFQFYPKDFLSDGNQGEMSLKETGAYARLMCRCWLEMTIPDDITRAANLCGATTAEMRQMWPAIRRCFRPSDVEPGRLIHPRLEKERVKQEAYRQRQSAKGRASAAARTGCQPEYNHGSTTVQPDTQPDGNRMATRGQPKSNSPISDLRSDLVLKNKQDQQPRRKERPQFQNQRFAVHRWQVDELISMLGVHVDSFDLDEWLMTGAAARAAEETTVIPDWWKWLKAETLAEARRRGLPLASTDTPSYGKQTSRLASALANIKREAV